MYQRAVRLAEPVAPQPTPRGGSSPYLSRRWAPIDSPILFGRGAVLQHVDDGCGTAVAGLDHSSNPWRFSRRASAAPATPTRCPAAHPSPNWSEIRSPAHTRFTSTTVVSPLCGTAELVEFRLAIESMSLWSRFARPPAGSLSSSALISPWWSRAAVSRADEPHPARAGFGTDRARSKILAFEFGHLFVRCARHLDQPRHKRRSVEFEEPPLVARLIKVPGASNEEMPELKGEDLLRALSVPKPARAGCGSSVRVMLRGSTKARSLPEESDPADAHREPAPERHALDREPELDKLALYAARRRHHGGRSEPRRAPVTVSRTSSSSVTR